MQFLFLAYDGRDEGAMERRSKGRPAHLENVKKLKEQGHFLHGGAILDDQGGMIGSVIFMDFPSRETLDAWLKADPYMTGGVWVETDVKPLRLVSL